MNVAPGQTVSVIDDDDAVRDSTLTLLESASLTCRGYSSAQNFLDAEALNQTSCIVLDLHMPEMSGLQFLEKIRAEGARVPVVIFSARVSEAHKIDIDSLGVVARLNKPTDAEMLIRTIERIIESRNLCAAGSCAG